MDVIKVRFCRWVATLAMIGCAWGVEVEAKSFAQRVAVAQAGDAVAVWSTNMGTYNCVQAATMSPSGVWSAPVTLCSLTESCSYPLVVVDGSGNYIALWSYFDTGFGTQALHASVYPVGGPTWGAPVRITTNMESVADFEDALENAAYQLTINSAGQAVAAWASYMGTDLDIRASNYSSGVWATPTTLSP